MTGIFIGGTHYTYDENDHFVLKTDLTKDGSPFAWVDYGFDDHGNLIGQMKSDISGNIFLLENCSYEYGELN